MPSLANEIVGERLTVLSKGPSASGKTIAACSFATEKRKAYVFDIDNRIQSVVSYYRKHDPSFLNLIFFDRYQTWTEINNKIDGWIRQGTCPFGVINLSSITSLGKIITNESISLRGNKEQSSSNAKDTLGTELMVGNIPVNSIQDYKAENSGISIILAKLMWHKAFAYTHIFVDAHLMEWRVEDLKDKNKVKVYRKIITAGKSIGEEIPTYFNEKWAFGTGIGQNGLESFIVKFRGIPEDDVDDAPSTTFFELPNSIDWTNKILAHEIGKYIPRFAKEETAK